MNGDEERRRKILIVSNTENDDARRYLTHALGVERGCGVVSTTADEVFDDPGVIEEVDAVLFDDVNPAECPRARKLVVELLRLHPSIKSLAILVGEKDWDDVTGAIRQVVTSTGRVYLHRHSESLEECLDFFARMVTADQVMSQVTSGGSMFFTG